MRSTNGTMQALLTGTVTNLARIASIVCADGTEYFFADYDRDIEYGGDTYSAKRGFTCGAILFSIGFNAQGLEVSTILADDLTEGQVRNGKFDNAVVTISVLNYSTPAADRIILFQGKISGKTRIDDQGYVTFDVQGKLASRGVIGVETYSSTCRADLGDNRCKVDIDYLSRDVTVSSVTTSQRFVVNDTSENQYWQLGMLQFTSGDNNGYAVEISQSFATGELRLFLPPPFPVQIGDTATLWPGCDKSIGMCANRYDNVVNFRGEPYFIPEKEIST